MVSILDVWGLQPALDNKAPVGHQHRIAEIEGLRGALDAVEQWQSQGGAQSIDAITGLQTALDGKASIADLADLEAELSGKATLAGTTTAFAALQTALDGKAPLSHTHTIDAITGLQTALDGKAPDSHTHGNATTSAAGFMSAADKTKLDGLSTSTGPAVVAIADVTGLQTALDGKAAAVHTHANATTSAAGFMSAADKTKLDGLSSSGSSENLSPALLTYTVSQSSVYNALSATYSNMTDGSLTTGGATSSTAENWIQFTFGNPTVFNRISMAGGALPGWGGAAQYFNGAALEISLDGSSWATLIQLLSGITDTGSLMLAFSPITAKALRVRRISYVSIGEFKVYG